jgi:hypothetical protein
MNFIPDCTLVTACYDLTKFNIHSRNIKTIINNIRSLLSTPCYLVIYCDNTTCEMIKEIRNKEFNLEKLTIYKNVPIEEWWSYQYLDKVKKNRETYWPTRDERTSAESHILVCNKLDFTLKIINENPFNSKKFGWVDAQADRMCVNYNPSKLLKIINNINEKFHIQILNVVDKKFKQPELKREFYQVYRYIVCGGFFTTGKNIGIKILNRLKENFVETTLNGYGHGEESLYLEILDEFYDDIERSYGDYGQMINNFNGITENIHYVYNLIFNNFYRLDYKRECFDCGMHLLKQIKNYKIWVEANIFFDIYFKTYLSAYYYKRDMAIELVKEIRELCKTYEPFNKVYLSNKEFYDNQFRYVE